MWRSRLLLVAAAAFAFASAANAQPVVVMDFEDLAIDDDLQHDQGPMYTAGDWMVSSPDLPNVPGLEFATFGLQHPDFPGSTSLYYEATGGDIRFERVDGFPFGMESIDISNLLDGEGPATVNFVGTTTSGDEVSASFTTSGMMNQLETFSFAGLGFDNIVGLEWIQESVAHQFDNITVVPSPAFGVTAEGAFFNESSLVIEAAVTEQFPDFGFEVLDAALTVDELGDPDTFVGAFTLSGPNGELMASIAGALVSEGGLLSLAGSFLINEGTGDFAGATGNGVLVAIGVGDEAGTITVDLQGVISTAPSCPADLNDDGSVGFADLQELLQAWGDCPAKGDCPADLNDDGSVGFADLQELLQAWGDCPE